MGKYILKRLLWLIPIMFILSLIAFFLMYLSPGDPATIYLSQGGDAPNAEALAILREKLGLNQPIWIQYLHWLGNVLRGNLGVSIFTGNPVAKEIAFYFPNTLKLTLLSLVLTLAISIPLGILAAVFENRLVDYIIRFLSFINGSMPGFFISMMLILILGVRLKWFPTVSSGNPMGIWIPTFTLSIALSATYIRQIRNAIIEELGQEYIKMCKARGIKSWSILFKGALRSSFPSILTLAGINFGALLGGTAIIEVVCSYQGIGRLAVNSITNRDYPLMQGYVLVMAFIYVVVNLVVDILHAFVDPRVKQRYIAEGVKEHKKYVGGHKALEFDK